MPFVFTALASDSFQRADENPLFDGGKWISSDIQILNDECISSSVGGGTAFWDSSFTANMYVQAQVAVWTGGDGGSGGSSLYLNLGTGGAYYSILISTIGIASGKVFFGLILTNSSFLFRQTITTAVVVGDVFKATVFGTTFTLYRNGEVVFTSVGTTPIDGALGDSDSAKRQGGIIRQSSTLRVVV